VLKKIEFLLTVRVPEAKSSEQQAEQAEERDRLSRSTSSTLVKKSAVERKAALTSSVEGTAAGNTPRILRARSTGTLKRSRPRGDSITEDTVLGVDLIASPTERRRQLLERKDTNENQRRVQESFKMWKLFRDRSKETESANAIDPAQDSMISDAVVAFIMDDKLEPSGLLKGLRQREERAQGRIEGLRTMNSLLAQINLRSVQYDLLLALLRGFKSGAAGFSDAHVLENQHYMYQAQGCQSATREELGRTFQALYAQLAAMLRSKDIQPIVKVLLMQLWTLGFREEDHGFLQKVAILPTLKKLISEETGLGASQDAAESPSAGAGDSGFDLMSFNLSSELADKKEVARAAWLTFSLLTLYCVGTQKGDAEKDADRAGLIERVAAVKAAAAASSGSKLLKSVDQSEEGKLPALGELQKRMLELIFNELSTSLRVFRSQPSSSTSAGGASSPSQSPAPADPFAHLGAQPGASWPKHVIPLERWKEFDQVERRCLKMIKLLHPLTNSVGVLRYIAENSHNMQTVLSLMLVGTPRIQRITLRLLRDVVPMVRPERLDYLWRLVIEDTYPASATDAGSGLTDPFQQLRSSAAIGTGDEGILSFFFNTIGAALCNVCPIASVDSAQTVASALAYLSRHHPDVLAAAATAAAEQPGDASPAGAGGPDTPSKLRVSFGGAALAPASPVPQDAGATGGAPTPSFSGGSGASPLPSSSTSPVTAAPSSAVDLLSVLDELSPGGPVRGSRSPRGRGKRSLASALTTATLDRPAGTSLFGSSPSPSPGTSTFGSPPTSPPAAPFASSPSPPPATTAFGSFGSSGTSTFGSFGSSVAAPAFGSSLSSASSTSSFGSSSFSSSPVTSGFGATSFGSAPAAAAAPSTTTSSPFCTATGNTSTSWPTFSFSFASASVAAAASSTSTDSGSSGGFTFGSSGLATGAASSTNLATGAAPAKPPPGWAHKSLPWKPKESLEKQPDARVAMALASEVIALLRHLLNTSSVWRDRLRELVTRSALDAPVLLRHEPKEPQLLKRAWRDLAALAVVGM
jgi:hypothetical protein